MERIYGDRGYVSQGPFESLYAKRIQLITKDTVKYEKRSYGHV